MNDNQRIELSDNMMGAMMKLGEGNPGALTAMMKMSAEATKIDPQSAFGPWSPLFSLDAIGVYGSHIWVLWKDVCWQKTLNIETLFRGVQLGIIPDRLVLAAARGEKCDFDFPALLAQVQSQVADFGRETVSA